MAPWAKEYTPQIKDVHHKLTITKPQNNHTKTVQYDALFNGQRTILVKGGHGTGKTLLCKKIAYDWAKGVFTKFYFVFAIFLDVIGPNSSIEDSIMKQCCMDVTQVPTLRHIFDSMANQCLVITDGLTEGVSQLLAGISSPNSSILVTSGLNDSNIGVQCSSVCKIQSCSRQEAKLLVAKGMEIAEVILECNPIVPPEFDTPECYSPMLVLVFFMTIS